MKPNDKNRFRDFLEDPSGELPADLAAELSPEELREAGRHRELDRKLRRALGELAEAADKRAPGLSEKDFRKNLLAAIDSATGSPADELAYLRKIRGRELTKRFVDRPAYGLGAVAALLALAFLPIVYQSQKTGPAEGEVALSETAVQDGPAGEAEPRLGAPAPAPAQAPVARKAQEQAAPAGSKPAAATEERQEDRLAMGTAPAQNTPAQGQQDAKKADAPTVAADVADEEVAVNLEAPAFRARGMSPKTEDAAAPAKEQTAPSVPLDVKQRLREKILTQKVKTARDKDAKLKALRDLEAFYNQNGQTAKKQNVQRQIQQLQ